MLALVDYYAAGKGGDDYEHLERDDFWALFHVTANEPEVMAALETWLDEVLSAEDAYVVKVVTVDSLIDDWGVDGQDIKASLEAAAAPQYSSAMLMALIGPGLNGFDDANDELRGIVENINP